MKEKSNTWNKDEKQEERERVMIRDLLVELRKRIEEEDEARNLIEEMQRNLDDAQNQSGEVEHKLNRILWEYIEAFDKERVPEAHNDKNFVR